MCLRSASYTLVKAALCNMFRALISSTKIFIYSLQQTSILGSKLDQTKMRQTVKRQSMSVPMAAAAIIIFLSVMALSVDAAVVEHTFVVSIRFLL